MNNNNEAKKYAIHTIDIDIEPWPQFNNFIPVMPPISSNDFTLFSWFQTDLTSGNFLELYWIFCTL